jgi:hypothetical protein
MQYIQDVDLHVLRCLGDQLPDLGLGHGSDIVTTTDKLSAEEDSGNGSATGELGEVVLDLVWGLVVLLPGIKIRGLLTSVITLVEPIGQLNSLKTMTMWEGCARH